MVVKNAAENTIIGIGVGVLSILVLALTGINFDFNSDSLYTIIPEGAYLFNMALPDFIAGTLAVMLVSMSLIRSAIKPDQYPALFWTTVVTTLLMAIFSFLLSASRVSLTFDSPHAQEVLSSLKQEMKARHDKEMIFLIDGHANEIEDMKRQAEQLSESTELNVIINKSRDGMAREMLLPDRNGNPIGHRYRAHQKTLERALTQQMKLKQAAQVRLSRELMRIRERHADEIERLRETHSHESGQLTYKLVSEMPESENQHALGFVRNFNRALGTDISGASYALLLSALLAVLLEISVLSLMRFAGLLLFR